MRTLLVDCYLRESELKMPHYRRMIEPHSQVRDVTAVQVGPGFDMAGMDAVVISGSQMMLSETEPAAALAKFCRGLRVPTLGVCFGHQLLARSFGAVVGRGERFLDFDGTIELLEPWPLFVGLGSGASGVVMRESHREFVTPESLAAIGWRVGARSASCAVEAMRHPSLPLYGVQFHPERSGKQGERLFASFYRLVVEPGR
jgi:GMP synthase (glutamine-hydrolysing)